jgi:hypothetical protein
MVVSKKSGGKTILLARDPVPTLWVYKGDNID